MVGYWATLSLNIPDFTRYARSQDSQILGQSFGLACSHDPLRVVRYRLHLAHPPPSSATPSGPRSSFSASSTSRVVAVLVLIGLLVATLNVNIGANVVGPSNDFANLAPNHISFRTGGLITGALGICIMPWRLLSSSSNFTGWLVAYSGFLGPVAGIMVADYFLLRHRTLNLDDLYRRTTSGGAPAMYEYTRGINPRAVIALLAGIALALIGRFVPALGFLFSGAWFTGFFTAAIVYLFLMRSRPAPVLR